MMILGLDGLDFLIAALAERPAASPRIEVEEVDVLRRLRDALGAAGDALEVWEVMSADLRQPVVRDGYVYEWNLFRRSLCITRLPGLVECERVAELYARSTPEELRRRLQQLEGRQFEMFLKSLLSADPSLSDVSTTPSSHDGGVDFRATMQESAFMPRVPLIGQAKRLTGSVTAGMVRDFIGALDTSGEIKSVVGLYVTTSCFTEPALDALRRSRFHVKTWDLTEVSARAAAAGIGTLRRPLEFVVLDETFWEELSGSS